MTLPWVVVGPHGVYYVGLHDDEAGAWTVALGWPDAEEIAERKADGWYAAQATMTWTQPNTEAQRTAVGGPLARRVRPAGQEQKMQIWKFPLNVTDLQSHPIPEGAQLLAVQTQDDMPQLWALVDEKAPIVHRNFATYGTGNPMPDGDPGVYVGTYQIRGGALVFHVFERAQHPSSAAPRSGIGCNALLGPVHRR